MEPTSKWHKFLGLPKWSPQIVPVGVPKLWTAITLNCRVRSQQGLNQSCSPRRDLSNAMSHSQIKCREEVDSWLLVVGGQTASLTPGPSFAHNLGCRCPNDPWEAILDIYVSGPFQWHQEHLNARCFGPCCRALNIRESRMTLNPPTLQVLGFTPTLGQSGVATTMNLEIKIWIRFSKLWIKFSFKNYGFIFCNFIFLVSNFVSKVDVVLKHPFVSSLYSKSCF